MSFEVPSRQSRDRIADASPIRVIRLAAAQLTLTKPPPTIMAAAGDEEHTGAMLALVPAATDVDRLALPDGEPVDELHLTLWYLGDAVDLPAGSVDELRAVAADVAATAAPVETAAFGVGLWNWAGDEPSVVLNVGDPERELVEVRAAVGDRAANALLSEWTRVAEAQHHPWVPHVCLAYTSDLAVVGEAQARVGTITFDRLRLAVGPDVYDYRLGGG